MLRHNPELKKTCLQFNLYRMPFICTFRLNNGAIKRTDEVIFEEFIDSSFGEYHEENIRIAKVNFNGKPAFVYSNSPCFPSTKGSLTYGDKLSEETEIGYFAADSENIPYNRPYAIIKFE